MLSTVLLALPYLFNSHSTRNCVGLFLEVKEWVKPPAQRHYFRSSQTGQLVDLSKAIQACDNRGSARQGIGLFFVPASFRLLQFPQREKFQKLASQTYLKVVKPKPSNPLLSPLQNLPFELVITSHEPLRQPLRRPHFLPRPPKVNPNPLVYVLMYICTLRVVVSKLGLV